MTAAIIIAVVGLSITIIVHLVTSVWWAARLTTRVETIEQWMRSNADLHEEVISMRVQVSQVATSVDEMKGHIGKIFEKLEGKADRGGGCRT